MTAKSALRLALLPLILALVACGNGEADQASAPAVEQPTISPSGNGGESSPSGETGSCDDLVDAAANEGPVVWYTGENTDIVERIADNFESAYGIPMEVNRSGTEKVANAFLQEADAGIHEADVLTLFNLSIFEDLKSRELLAADLPPNAGDLDERFRDPDGYWMVTNADLYGIAYNSEQVDDADVPSSWDDLLDERWRGELVMGSPLYSGTVVLGTAGLVDLYGWEYFDQLAELDPMIVQSVLDTANPIVSGERTVGLGSAQFTRQTAAAGNPIAFVMPDDGAIFVPAGVAMAAEAPNPNAAKLFLCYYLSDETQQLLADEEYYPVSENVELAEDKSPLSELDLVIVDPTQLLEESADLKDQFEQRFGG